MPFKKGESGNLKGRRKGSQNKFTDLKQAFLNAFEQTGGIKGLVTWVQQSPRNRAVFYQMITKLFPTTVQHEGSESKPLRLMLVSDNPNDKNSKNRS